MKKIFTSVLSIAFGFATYAQNPASTVLSTNFDGAFGGIVNPTGWISANLTTTDVVSAVAPGYGGSPSAAKITTKTINTLFGIPLPPVIPTQSGLLISGTIAAQGTAITIRQGQPYTSRPEGMAYWTKYTPVATDSAFAYILLSKWNVSTSKRDTIGIAADTISSAIASWTKRLVPINYINSTDNPDTMLIIFSSSSRTHAQLGSVYHIDEISMYPVNTSGVKDISNNYLYMNPNPTSGKLMIKNSDRNISLLRIVDVSGQIVLEQNLINENEELDLTNLDNGLYFAIGYDTKKQQFAKSRIQVIK